MSNLKRKDSVLFPQAPRFTGKVTYTHTHTHTFAKKTHYPSFSRQIVHLQCVCVCLRVLPQAILVSERAGLSGSHCIILRKLQTHMHTDTHLCPSNKKSNSVALLPEDTLTVLDLHRSTLLMRGQETEHTQEGRVKGEEGRFFWHSSVSYLQYHSE